MNEFRGKVQHIDYFGNPIEEVEKKETSAFKPDGKVTAEELKFLQDNLAVQELELPRFPGSESLSELRHKFKERKKTGKENILNYSQKFIAQLKEKLKINPIDEEETLMEFIETDVNNLVENIIGKPGLKMIQEFFGLEQSGNYSHELFRLVIDFQRKFTPNNVDGIANETVLYKIQTFLSFARNMQLDREKIYYRGRDENNLEELYADVLKLKGGSNYELFRNIFTGESSDTGCRLKHSAFHYDIEAFDLFGDFEEIYVDGKKYVANKDTRKFFLEGTKEELILTKESVIYKENLEWTKSLDGLEEFYKKHGIVIREMAKHLGFTEEYLLAILSMESIYKVTARSSTGSTGYMQVTGTMFSDFIRVYKSRYNYAGRGINYYLPILKDFSDFFVNLMSNKESVELMQEFKNLDRKDKKTYNKTVREVRRKLKTRRLVEHHPRLNLAMGGTYLKVVHDTLGIRHMYGELAWYKPFLKIKLDRVNEVLKERGTKITQSDLDEFKSKIKNKEFTKEELRLLLAARIYNGAANLDEGIPHKYYYGAIVYFLSKHLKKQRNAVN